MRQLRRLLSTRVPGHAMGAPVAFTGAPPTVIRALNGGAGHYCIDTTEPELAADAPVVDLRGWVALEAGPAAVVGPHLSTRAGARMLTAVERRDVVAEFPGRRVLGFDEVVDLEGLLESTGAVVIEIDGVAHELAIPPVARAHERAAAFRSRKAALLAAVRPVLACPRDRDGLVDGADGDLHCRTCGYLGRRSTRGFALTPEGTEVLVPTPPFSAHRYDVEPRELIAEHLDGLVLDFGAGLRLETFDNVVNLDLSDFPTTDVLGSCLALPFADRSFDGLISVAVLEHVSDPPRAAAEIARVVRPGAPVYIAVPFLQPYHGWPNHYFNMTRDGLRVLFEEDFAITDIVTPYGGLPMRALTWIVDRYLAGLPEPVRTAFGNRRISELATAAEPHLDQDYVTALSADTVAELASVNVLYARRR